MMARAAKSLLAPAMRPFTIMACAIVVLGIMDRGHGYFFSIGTVFSVMQLFATVGLVALGLGLSMLVREFDLSVAGIVGLAGCIAVMTGVENPWLGVVLGVGAGVVSGVLQGLIMTRLGLSSVGVTLGGANSTDYAIADTCAGKTLASGAACTIGVSPSLVRAVPIACQGGPSVPSRSSAS